LQTTPIAEASSPQKNDISALNADGEIPLSELDRPKAFWDSSVVLPKGSVFQENGKNPIVDVSALHEYASPIASSFPAQNYEMVGKVPYFVQSGGTCGLYSMMQVLWWYGRTDVHASDIGNYLGKDEGPHYLWELDDAFAHYLPDSWHTYGGFDSAGEAKEWVKSNIHLGTPVICCIHAPGTTTGGWANHYVTIVGYDDNLDGGAWCLHDTGGWWTSEVGADTDYDVWCTYDDFDQLWDEWYTMAPGGEDTRGVVAADAGDWKFSYSQASLSGLHDIYDDETMTLQLSLTNVGQDDSKSAGPNGIYVRFVAAEIININLGGFDDYNSYDQSGTALGHVLPTRRIELYDYDQLVQGATISASVTVKPYYCDGGTVMLRGWITDEDDYAREDWVTIDDDRPGLLTTMLAEPRIVRYPYTMFNDVDDVVGGYPLLYEYFLVTDDDPDPPSLYDVIWSETIYDSDSGDYLLQVSASDPSGISSVYFAYHFGDDPLSDLKPYDGQSGETYWYYIPRSEWINHIGESVAWYVQAWDNDDDRPNDAEGTAISVSLGHVYDDDTQPPGIIYPGLYVGEELYPAEGVSDSYFGNVRLQVTIGRLMERCNRLLRLYLLVRYPS